MTTRLLVALCVGLTLAPGVHGQARVADESAAVRGMRFETYIRLQNGMSEGELLSRAGRPDMESTDALVRRNGLIQAVKTWTYLATPGDPFITTVTLMGGRISNLNRERQIR